jgi:hypothetical protein
MQTKRILSPLVCGVAWAALMCVVAATFIGARHLLALVWGAPAGRMFGGDRWLSLGMLLMVSFVAGFSIAWLRRRRQPIRPKSSTG